MEVFTTYDIVKKLIGNIEPVGETNEDRKRYDNLEDMFELVYLLLKDIKKVSEYSDRQEASVKRIAKKAYGELVFFNNYLTNGLTDECYPIKN